MIALPAPVIGSDPIRVLIADADAVFTMLASSSLATAGFEVRIARDGGEALSVLDRGTIELAAIDLSLPGDDGYRLIAWLRAACQLQHLAIVALSPEHDASAVAEAYRLGADVWLPKPVSWLLLPVHLRHAMQRARATAELQAELRALKSAYLRAQSDTAR